MGKIIIPVVALLIVLIGAGAGTYASIYLQQQKEAASKPAVAASVTPINYDMPEIFVGLTQGDARGRILRISLTLLCSSDDDLLKIKEYQPRVFDALQVYLRDLSPADMRGRAGLDKIRKDLPPIINKVIAPGRIDSVLVRTLGITDT